MDFLFASASTAVQVTTREISIENTNFQDIEILVTRALAILAARVAQQQQRAKGSLCKQRITEI